MTEHFILSPAEYSNILPRVGETDTAAYTRDLVARFGTITEPVVEPVPETITQPLIERVVSNRSHDIDLAAMGDILGLFLELDAYEKSLTP